MSADEALAEAARQGELSGTKRAILEVLLEEGKGMKPMDIAGATGLRANVVRQRLHQMVKSKAGEVRKHGNEYWHPDCVADDPK